MHSVKTPLFVAKEYIHRLPDPFFRHSFEPLRADVDVDNAVERLKKDGIVSFPAYFDGAFLHRLQENFDEIISKYSMGGGVNPECDFCDDILHYDESFVTAALDNTLLEIIARYYRKRFGIGRADAMRIYPMEESRYGSFQWHHDTRGRQIKAQILLADVPQDGQRMTYIKGSHTTYYSRHRGRGPGSRFEFDMAQRRDVAARVVDVFGPAGTVTLFDTNGLHSGNRNLTATRDNITFYYPTARNFKKLKYHKSHLADLPEDKLSVLRYNPHCEFI